MEKVREALAHLPSDVGLLHPRAVVPVMFTLRVRRPLNLLGAEALAVALLLRSPLDPRHRRPFFALCRRRDCVGYQFLA